MEKSRLGRKQQEQTLMKINSSRSRVLGKTRQIYKTKDLLNRYKNDIKDFIQHPESQKKVNKQKGTNIPKFIINIFLRNYPLDLESEHLKRLNSYRDDESKSKTCFDLEELFGICDNDKIKDLQNHLNRIVLMRILNDNYQNILTNQHIINKKTYLLFCKKLILRLQEPHLIDRLEVS